VVVGKPSEAFYAAALGTLGVEAGEAVMVGDDLEADVLGAQRAGIPGVLVRTGKYAEKDEHGDGNDRPRHVIDSIADLPALLDL
jgi:ribonucleotide monophosphatase NagD (HAD superfamily)